MNNGLPMSASDRHDALTCRIMLEKSTGLRNVSFRSTYPVRHVHYWRKNRQVVVNSVWSNLTKAGEDACGPEKATAIEANLGGAIRRDIADHLAGFSRVGTSEKRLGLGVDNCMFHRYHYSSNDTDGKPTRRVVLRQHTLVGLLMCGGYPNKLRPTQPNHSTIGEMRIEGVGHGE
jgi:hypothetical protein